jgi:hypothetical protein
MQLFADGTINGVEKSKQSWSIANGKLLLHWKNPQAPGGVWIDTCQISDDGMTYNGHNQVNGKVAGKLVLP